MANQTVNGIHVILPNIIRVLQVVSFETLCEIKVSQAQHSFQKLLLFQKSIWHAQLAS